jgi:hypothetical protein
MPNGAENPIVEENRKTGNSFAEWAINGAGDPENQGFATDISVNQGRPFTSKSTPMPRNIASKSTAWGL